MRGFIIFQECFKIFYYVFFNYLSLRNITRCPLLFMRFLNYRFSFQYTDTQPVCYLETKCIFLKMQVFIKYKLIAITNVFGAESSPLKSENMQLVFFGRWQHIMFKHFCTKTEITKITTKKKIVLVHFNYQLAKFSVIKLNENQYWTHFQA